MGWSFYNLAPGTSVPQKNHESYSLVEVTQKMHYLLLHRPPTDRTTTQHAMPKRMYILCVEDEPEVLDAIVKDLAEFEDLFPVETARSVSEARTVVARIQEARDALALVLCDHIMPGENGVEFLIELYRDPYTATTRKILLTGQAGLDATVRAVNFANLDFYIGKPWSKDELCAGVKHQMKAYILAHGREVERFASLFGERELAEAMMSKFPGAR